MNNQEIYNTVRDHLLAQGKPATIKGVCAYRGDDGLKCAVGCLIPDELYSRDLEGQSVQSTDVFKVLTRAGVVESTEQASLLTRLQYVHDVYEPEEWASRLRTVAADFGLQP